jgi:hypothetical protein
LKDLFLGFRFGRFGVEEGVVKVEVTVFEEFFLDVVDFDQDLELKDFLL